MKTLYQIMFLLCLMVARLSSANPGDLDSSFSGDGKNSLDIFSLNDSISDVHVQKDGKIVATGRSFVGGNTYGTIIRLKTDGTPDPSFNGGGVVFITQMYAANAVVIQDDGKIVVGGLKSSYNDFVLARYDSTGTLDFVVASFALRGRIERDGQCSSSVVRPLDSGNPGRRFCRGSAFHLQELQDVHAGGDSGSR